MIELSLESGNFGEEKGVAVSLHPSFQASYQKLVSCIQRFPLSFDESAVNDLLLFYSLAKRKFLDHRDPVHLLRMSLSIYSMQRKLLSSSTLSSHMRHLEIRWMPTNLLFPFSSKPVLGCMIGFNVMDRCELFDEENVVVALQKHFPELQLVKESYHRHSSQHENLRIFYFEIEKKSRTSFSLLERKLLKINLEEKIKNSIQKLVPSVFMKFNQEEVYKNILVLSQEITQISDLPQVSITLDQHTGKEVIFHVSLVQISPFHRFSFKERLYGCSFILERMLPVRYIEGRPIEAYLFRLLLPCDTSLLRSDGSLDFYAARQRVVSLLSAAVGEFRDYNGGLLIKQQELLYLFKENLPKQAAVDEELMENFFHNLVPLEKQALLDPKILSNLYLFFLNKRGDKQKEMYALKEERKDGRIYLSSMGANTLSDSILPIIRMHLLDAKDWAYNFLDLSDGTFFNCILSESEGEKVEGFIHALQDALLQLSAQAKNQQNLRIALSHSMFSLDPRVGGENVSGGMLRLLFEGLTRFSSDGQVENAGAERIDISPDLKSYTFHLRSCYWNDGSIVTAHDFEYAWKKILSPDFKTSFAALFYPILNAKEAKEGERHLSEVGIHVLNDRTLKVDLIRPTSYFLQLIAHPIFSPVHRLIDKECPQWPYQSEKNYPCNGPFQLKLNQPNRGYQLVKNPTYWAASEVKLDQITLTQMDSVQASHAFLRNEIDWMGAPFGGVHNSNISKEKGKVLTNPNGGVWWFVFNTEIEPFCNTKVRQAFAYGIDRTQLVQDVGFPLPEAYSVLLPRYSENRDPMFPKFDREKALSLLEEGLKEEGIDLNDFSIQLTYHPKGFHEKLALALKKYCEEVLGIPCYLQPFAWDTFFQRMTEGRFQVGLINWASLIDDPIFTLGSFKFSKEGVNFSNWESADFQKLIDLSEEETSPFQRSLQLFNAEKILSQDVPVIPLTYHPAQSIVRSNFQNFQQPNGGFVNLSRGFFKRR